MSRIALILCGGKGTRFRTVSTSPKILARFGNKLFFDWIVEYLKNNGFEKVILSVGYKSKEISNYVEKNRNKFSIEIDFCHEDTPLGTGGAIINFFKKTNLQDIFVFNGDTYWPNPIPEAFFEKKLDVAICLATSLERNDRYGDFMIRNEKLLVSRGSPARVIHNSLVYVGISRLSCSATLDLPTVNCSLEELLSKHEKGIFLLQETMPFFDYGTPEAYAALEKYSNG